MRGVWAGCDNARGGRGGRGNNVVSNIVDNYGVACEANGATSGHCEERKEERRRGDGQPSALLGC